MKKRKLKTPEIFTASSEYLVTNVIGIFLDEWLVMKEYKSWNGINLN